jgi:hypothetical protein
MGEFRDMGIPAHVVKKDFFATRAGIPMSLNSPMQKEYSSMSHYVKIVGVQSRNKCSLWNVERKE